MGRGLSAAKGRDGTSRDGVGERGEGGGRLESTLLLSVVRSAFILGRGDYYRPFFFLFFLFLLGGFFVRIISSELLSGRGIIHEGRNLGRDSKTRIYNGIYKGRRGNGGDRI